MDGRGNDEWQRRGVFCRIEQHRNHKRYMETEKFTEEQIINMAQKLGVSLTDGITEDTKQQLAERLALVFLELSDTKKKY
jgi:hypothetical protein